MVSTHIVWIEVGHEMIQKYARSLDFIAGGERVISKEGKEFHRRGIRLK